MLDIGYLPTHTYIYIYWGIYPYIYIYILFLLAIFSPPSHSPPPGLQAPQEVEMAWWNGHLEKWWTSSMGFGWHPIYLMEHNPNVWNHQPGDFSMTHVAKKQWPIMIGATNMVIFYISYWNKWWFGQPTSWSQLKGGIDTPSFLGLTRVSWRGNSDSSKIGPL